MSSTPQGPIKDYRSKRSTTLNTEMKCSHRHDGRIVASDIVRKNGAQTINRTSGCREVDLKTWEIRRKPVQVGCILPEAKGADKVGCVSSLCDKSSGVIDLLKANGACSATEWNSAESIPISAGMARRKNGK